MRETTEISLEDYRRLSRAQPRQRAKRAPRADIPRAPRQEATGLHVLIAKGWSIQSPDSVQYRLYKIGEPGMDTGLCDSEKAACDRAKALAVVGVKG
jgi:hypothetical protein